MKIKKTSEFIVYNADNMNALRRVKSNFVDAVVTDPPYGLSKEPDIEKMLIRWLKIGHYDHRSKSGFMGKEWDAFVPQPLLWKEVFRVLKPGGHALVFFGTRTYDIGVLALRIAGFEIRDTISWIYGQGFPKSLDVSKAIDKSDKAACKVSSVDSVKCERRKDQLNGSSSVDAVKYWRGWGTALKPSQELIVLVRKPMQTSVALNVLEHRTGALNIDGCRIFTRDKLDGGAYTEKGSRRDLPSATRSTKGAGMYAPGKTVGVGFQQPEGRWPSNVILTHDARCKMLGHAHVKNSSGSVSGNEPSATTDKIYGKFKGRAPYVSKPVELVECWECHEDCPVRIMNEQSLDRKSSAQGLLRNAYNKSESAGGASRFFYCAKVSRKERNAGLEDLEPREWKNENAPIPQRKNRPFIASKNNHPTVKPVELMRYLVRLITPKHGIVLDPFMGSGSTGVAVMKEGCRFIGMEQSEEYAHIALKRIIHATKQAGLLNL